MQNEFGYGIGYELEVYGIIPNKVKELLHNSLVHETKNETNLDYSKYNIMPEIEVTDKLHTGGEIISPIIYSEKELLESIRIVLDVLKKTNGYDRNKRNSSASLHFHFGIEALDNNKEYYLRLIKFLKAFEGEIYYHSHQKDDELRKSINIFARPYTKQIIYEIIDYFIENEPIYQKPIEYLTLKKYMFRLDSKTFEFRTCNNPLVDNTSITSKELFNYEESYKVFLSYFHMWQSIIEYVKSPSFETDRINLYYQITRDNPYTIIKERERVFKRIIKIE